MFTEKQKIDRGYFLFESERKAKKEKMEKWKEKCAKTRKKLLRFQLEVMRLPQWQMKTLKVIIWHVYYFSFVSNWEISTNSIAYLSKETNKSMGRSDIVWFHRITRSGKKCMTVASGKCKWDFSKTSLNRQKKITLS